MGLDLRLPLGLMFLAIGLLLLGYGVLTWCSPMYARSMGQNVNVIWGGIMSLFGLAMLLLARRAAAKPPVGDGSVTGTTVPRRAH